MKPPKESAALLSIASNTGLTLLKLVGGILTSSISVISEAIHSGIDLLAAIIAYLTVRFSDRPADREHPFGHGKLENLSAVFEALLILVAAAWIIVEAVRRLTSGESPHILALPGLIIMLVSIVVNIFVSRRLFFVADKTDSPALEADAEHLRTDVYSSLAVCAGLAGIIIARNIAPDVESFPLWLDCLAGIFVSVLIARIALSIVKRSIDSLVDRRLPEEEEREVGRLINAALPEGMTFHELRSRKAGSYRHIDLHIQSMRGMTLEHAHDVSHQIKQQIETALPRTSVIIHVEPPLNAEPVPPDSPEVAKIRNIVESEPGVLSVRDLSLYPAGNGFRVEGEIFVDGTMPINEGFQIKSSVSKKIRQELTEVLEVALTVGCAREDEVL
ncbi:cation diffusion facilitator family transporter [Acidobacteriota bacterium]